MTDLQALSADYTERARSCGVPAHLIDGLVLYIVHGVMPGHFLEAVLTNDLMEAFGRADAESRFGMFHLVQFLYNEAPAPCFGSVSKVQKWAEQKRERRTA